jgi:hypothetical protein
MLVHFSWAMIFSNRYKPCMHVGKFSFPKNGYPVNTAGLEPPIAGLDLPVDAKPTVGNSRR